MSNIKFHICIACGVVLSGDKVYSCNNCRGLKFNTFECVGDFKPYVPE